jgi:hypothetical protein
MASQPNSGRVVLPANDRSAIREKVEKYNTFNHDNDP